MTSPRFSEVENGYAFPALVQKIEQDTIDRYALGSMDMNPVHTNTEWSEAAQVFGMPCTVTHGMFTMSNTTSVVTRQWGVVNDNGGRVKFVEVKFTKVVPVGETITATAKVQKKHYHGPGKNWVSIKSEARDTAGDVVAAAEIGYLLAD